MGSVYRGGLFQGLNLTASEGIAGGVFMALVMGSIVYGLHRTLFNPWIEILRYGWLRDRLIIKDGFFSKRMLSKEAVDTLVDRWDYTLRLEHDKDIYGKNSWKAARYRGLSAWSDYIHLFYCCGFALLFGSIINWINLGCAVSFDALQCSLILIFLFLGGLSDVRRQYVEDRCIPEPKRLTRRC